MNKIIGAIFLTLILIFQFSGGQLLFHIQRSQIRREIKSQIKQGVPKGEMVHFRFSKSNPKIHWHNDHEFRFENQMYDVVHQESTADSLFLECINDNQETLLFAKLDKLVKKRWNDHQSRSQQKITSSLSSHYLASHSISIPPLYSSIVIIPLPYTFKVLTWVKLPDSPPPRFIG